MCEHRKLRKNYPFGRKSKPRIICKDCGAIITPSYLAQSKKNNRRKGTVGR